jgi:hypothetical protein
MWLDPFLVMGRTLVHAEHEATDLGSSPSDINVSMSANVPEVYRTSHCEMLLV